MSLTEHEQGAAYFDLFVLLPAEIRLQIWLNNTPEPRIVPLRHYSACQKSRSERSPTAAAYASWIPRNLHACQESRIEALKQYRKLYKDDRRSACVYLDCEQDILLLDAYHGVPTTAARLESLLSPLSPSAATSIQNVAITEDLFSDMQAATRSRSAIGLRTEDILRQLCRRLPKLQRITIVHRNSNNNGSNWAGQLVNGIHFIEPPVRNRFIERQVRRALDLIDREADAGWTRPSLSIRTLCRKKRDAAGASSAGQIDRSYAGGNMNNDHIKSSLSDPQGLIAASGGRLDDPRKLLPPSAAPPCGKRNSDGGCSRSSLVLPSSSSAAATLSIPSISSPSPSSRRCMWMFAELPGASGILDYAASRLAFYRRYNYWA